MQLPQTKDSFNYACAEIQKADGTSHPLLKLSLLNFVKLRLEGEVQFGEDGISIFAVFFAFKIIVVNYCNNVFSNCPACANVPAFVTLVEYVGSFSSITNIETISGRAEVSISGLVEVTYMQAIGTRFVSRSAFPSEVCPPAVFVCIIVVFIAAHVFSSQYKIRSEVVAYANVPDFFVKVIGVSPVTNFCVGRRIGFKVSCISVYCAHVSFNACNIKAVFRINHIFKLVMVGIRTFSSKTKYFYFVAVGNFNAIKITIKYVTGEKDFVPTAGGYVHTAKTTFNVSAFQFYIIITFFISISLSIFKHTGVGPVFVNLAVYPQTSTKPTFIAVNIAVNIFVRETSLTGDFYVVSFFLKVSNANAEAVEFISKFSS